MIHMSNVVPELGSIAVMYWRDWPICTGIVVSKNDILRCQVGAGTFTEFIRECNISFILEGKMIITKISNINDWNILWNEYIGYRRAFEDKNNSDLHSRHINIKLELCHNHAQHMLLEYSRSPYFW